MATSALTTLQYINGFDLRVRGHLGQVKTLESFAGRATINAEPAGADDARWLKMRKGDPMLVERRVILDQQGRPLEFTESRYPADRYALDVDFVVEGQTALRRT